MDRRSSFVPGRQRMSMTDRKTSFAVVNRRKSSTPGGLAIKRASMEPTTVPLVGRQSILQEEKPKDRMPVGAYPKGVLEYPAQESAERRESRVARPSLGNDLRASIAAFNRKRESNVEEAHKYSAGKTPNARKQSIILGLPVSDAPRRQSIHHHMSDSRRQSMRGEEFSSGRRASQYQSVERRRASMFLSSAAESRRQSSAGVGGQSLYGGGRLRASSFASAAPTENNDAVEAEEEEVAPPSIGSAEDVDLESGSSVSSVRTAQEGQRYVFESRFEHFLIFVCYTLGFNNMWAFTNFAPLTNDRPSIVHHIISYVCIAMPMLYMEMFIGQYSQRGVLLFGRIIPLAYGFGWAVLLFAIYFSVDITISMGDALFYFIVSFAGTPWMDCNHEFDNRNVQHNHTCLDASLLRKCKKDNAHRPAECMQPDMEFSATLFYNHFVVPDEYDMNEPLGGLRLGRIVCSLLSWGIITLTTLMGFNKYKRILQIGCILILTFLLILMVMVTAIHSHVLLSSIAGMFEVHSGSFTSIRAWTMAITSALNEVSLCQGGHILFGSFMQPKTEGDLDSIVFIIACIVANLLGGLFSQSVIHVLKTEHVVLVPSLIEGKESLYTTIPQGLGSMQVPQLLSILYFSLLFITIYQNQVVQLDVIVESIIDAVPKTTVYRKYMVSLFGVTGFLLGVPYATGVGHQLQHDLEGSRMLYIFIVLNLAEPLCVLWLYGTQKFSDDIHFMLGAQPTLFWKICWRAIPAVLLMTLFYCPTDEDHNMEHELSVSIKTIGICYCVLSISPLVIGGVYKCLKYLQYHNLVGVLKPESEWGHPDAHERLMRHIYNPRHETRSRRRDMTCKHRCLKESAFLKQLNFSEKMAATNMEIVVEADDKKQLRKGHTPQSKSDVSSPIDPQPKPGNDSD